MNFRRSLFIDVLCGLDSYFVFNLRNSKIKNLCCSLRSSCIHFEFGNALLEFRRFAGSIMGSDMLSSSAISAEDQVCQNTGYDRMFGDIALALLSGLRRRQSHPESWLHLSFRGH